MLGYYKYILLYFLKISRCVIKFEGKHRTMTNDHYPFIDVEKQRIGLAGGELWENRINAHLPISRGFGHLE
jgi:protein phosphatase 2C family protein 2/3